MVRIGKRRCLDPAKNPSRSRPPRSSRPCSAHPRCRLGVVAPLGSSLDSRCGLGRRSHRHRPHRRHRMPLGQCRCRGTPARRGRGSAIASRPPPSPSLYPLLSAGLHRHRLRGRPPLTRVDGWPARAGVDGFFLRTRARHGLCRHALPPARLPHSPSASPHRRTRQQRVGAPRRARPQHRPSRSSEEKCRALASTHRHPHPRRHSLPCGPQQRHRMAGLHRRSRPPRHAPHSAPRRMARRAHSRALTPRSCYGSTRFSSPPPP